MLKSVSRDSRDNVVKKNTIEFCSENELLTDSKHICDLDVKEYRRYVLEERNARGLVYWIHQKLKANIKNIRAEKELA